MMTQEEFMDVQGVHAAGMSFVEIAEATGYHRTTIAKWIKAGGPPQMRGPVVERVVLTDRWQRRIAQLLDAQPASLSTSIHDVVAAEGFTGSYVTVVRAVPRYAGRGSGRRRRRRCRSRLHLARRRSSTSPT